MFSNKRSLKSVLLLSLLCALTSTAALYCSVQKNHTVYSEDPAGVTIAEAVPTEFSEAVTGPALPTAGTFETETEETTVEIFFDGTGFETGVSLKESEPASIPVYYRVQRTLFSILFAVFLIFSLALTVLNLLFFRRFEIKESAEFAAFILFSGAALGTLILSLNPEIYHGPEASFALFAFFIAVFFLSFGLNGFVSFMTSDRKLSESLLYRYVILSEKKKTFGRRLMVLSLLTVSGGLLFLFTVFFLPLCFPERFRFSVRIFGLFFLFITILAICLYRAAEKRFDEERASAIEQAKASERLRVDLIQNVSHDLRTPLTAILGYSELLKKEALSDEGAAELQKLNDKAGYMKALVENLFELTKVSSGVIKSRKDPLDLIRLIEQTLAFYNDSLEKAGLKIVRHYPPETKLQIVSDGRFLNQILSNLLNNVVKYALSGTRVHITVMSAENNAEVRITNVASYEMTFDASTITERFVRGDDTRSSSGNGIGLAIAVTYAESLGGRFHAETDGDQFTAVLTLPL